MNQHQFHKIWIEQCDATEGIKERFGQEKAIHYLIGEKFLNFLEESDRRPEFASEVLSFVAGIREIFERHEISEFFERLLHERSVEADEDWPFDDFEDAELEPADVVREAEAIQLIERARELLVDRG